MWGRSQREAATSLSDRYPDETTDEWAEMRDKFDKNLMGPNPYKEPKNRTIFVSLSMFRY